MSIGKDHVIEAEVLVERGNEASLEFQVGRLEAEVGLDAPKHGRVEVSFEAGGDELEFHFRPKHGLERTFTIEVKGHEYAVELEAGFGEEVDEDPHAIEVEATIKPVAPTKAVELKLEVDRGDSGVGELKFKEVEFGLTAEAVGNKYLVEVELQNPNTGRSIDREFLVDPRHEFEKEFKVTLGHRTFELDLSTETDRKEGEFAVSLDAELAHRMACHDDAFIL
jgi:hypothetical protein